MVFVSRCNEIRSYRHLFLLDGFGLPEALFLVCEKVGKLQAYAIGCIYKTTTTRPLSEISACRFGGPCFGRSQAPEEGLTRFDPREGVLIARRFPYPRDLRHAILLRTHRSGGSTTYSGFTSTEGSWVMTRVLL